MEYETAILPLDEITMAFVNGWRGKVARPFDLPECLEAHELGRKVYTGELAQTPHMLVGCSCVPCRLERIREKYTPLTVEGCGR